jgi:hypothetical protein
VSDRASIHYSNRKVKAVDWSLIAVLSASLCGIAASQGRVDDAGFAWEHGETSLALRKQGKIVWRVVFDPAQPKSYFHPLASIEGQVMTEFEPADHPWHRGLWWSWKFINGVNYWEEDPKTGQSAGQTRMVGKKLDVGDDFSARIELDLQYHPPEQKPVLTEKRMLAISRPDVDGTYVIDWTSRFTAADQVVKFDRTVPAHLGGVSYGGYAGLSLRMAKGLEGFTFRTSEGGTTAAGAHGKPARWVDLSGPGAGIAILDHPNNPRQPPPWYLHSKPPMLFFSPSPLFNEPLELAPGQSIGFSYRVIVHSRPVTPADLEGKWRGFSQEPAKLPKGSPRER